MEEIGLVADIPVSIASAEQSFLDLKDIKSYARNTTGQTRLLALAQDRMSLKAKM